MPGNMQVVCSANESNDQFIGRKYYQSNGLTEPVWEVWSEADPLAIPPVVSELIGGAVFDFYSALVAEYPEADEHEWRYETGEIIVCDDFTTSDEKKQILLQMAQQAIYNNPGE